MTVSTFRRWTCNVCKDRLDTPSDAQPPGWRGYTFTADGVPLSSEADDTGHLCEVCVRTVAEAMAERERR